jgi:thiamine-phosphate pyrophosphorylase
MAPQLYLITPENPPSEQFPRQLMSVLSGPEIAALLIRRGSLDERDYADLSARVIQVGQAAGAAVLIEDDVDLAKKLGADGVHVTSGGIKAVRAAIDALKPDGIVGVGNIRSRHDAMSFGELDVDYVMFGPLSGPADPGAAELASWWAETFEVPAIYADPAIEATALDTTGAEFVALSDCIWAADDPAAALLAFAKAAGTAA